MSRSNGEVPEWPAAPERPGPLAGLRVLDLSRVLAGPFATMLLADLGADVVKIESPHGGDETRRWGPPFAPDGTAAYFLAVNRNKRSVALDLSASDQAGLARRLAGAADVVVDNFLPGRLARFGLDPARLREEHPHLVTCTVSGYGSDTVDAANPGYDFLVQAAGGLMSITGTSDSPPAKVGVAIADLGAGLFAAVGILAALRDRERTGRGHHVEVPLFDAQVGLLANQAMNWLVGGLVPQRLGDAHPNIAPYQSFPTADEPLAVAVGTDRQFRRLCEVLDRSALADDPRFATNAARVTHRPLLTELLTTGFATRGRDEWVTMLTAAGVPVAPINDMAEVFAEPMVRDRLVVEVEGVPQVRSPILVDGSPVSVDRPPPVLGADTTDVLRLLAFPPASATPTTDTRENR